MSYIELHARSAFSFLRGASFPEQPAAGAAELNYPAMALCDRDGVYGAPRFFAANQEKGVRSIIGAELTMEDGSILPVLVESRRGYQNLCRLIPKSQLVSEKGQSAVLWAELPEFAQGLVALTGDEEGPVQRTLQNCTSGRLGFARLSSPSPLNRERDGVRGKSVREASKFSGVSQVTGLLRHLIHIFGSGNVFVEIQRHYIRGEERWLRALVDLAEQYRLPLLA